MQTHKACQEENTHNLTVWDEAILDAVQELEHADAARSKRLKAAIENFKANKQRGTPWPGQTGNTVTDAKDRNTETSQHRISPLPICPYDFLPSQICARIMSLCPTKSAGEF